jgi:phosphopentomutase
MRFKRIFLIILDSLGIGEDKDAIQYGDEGANTLKHILENTNISLPNLKNLGLLNTINMNNSNTEAYYTTAQSISIGKDTLVGHHELMGIQTTVPFKRFTDTGFPSELINEIEKATNRKVIGNKAASGTEIIEELGEEHMKTGALIIYTSADSVLQVAAHEDIISIKELYEICEKIRNITLKEEWKVGRIIARPFIGTKGHFIRTANRHDYALKPIKETVLDYLKNNNYDVISIGKINDIFDHQGITEVIKTLDNLDGINKIISTMDKNFTGLCFANLNDFDSKYGHRRDIKGYSEAIKQFDNYVPNIINKLNNDDLLIITADHGNDPSYKGTDHTRENIPVLIYSKQFGNPSKLDKFNTYAVIGYTIADNFNVNEPDIGYSILNNLK